MEFQSSCPLQWPSGWGRTDANSRDIAKFRGTVRNYDSGTVTKYTRPHTMDESASHIIRELDRLGVDRLVISTNVPANQSGIPSSRAKIPQDPGAAVYFDFHKKRIALACDKWTRAEDNLWAIGCHIEAMRGQERWGVGSIDQAFTGYQALPAPGQHGARTWYVILGVSVDAGFDRCRDAYRRRALELHPDQAGGDHSRMSELNAAWDECKRVFNEG